MSSKLDLSFHKHKEQKNEIKHSFLMQVVDYTGTSYIDVSPEVTPFKLDITFTKKKNRVYVKVPTFNFQILPAPSFLSFNAEPSPPFFGGYLSTLDCPLPKCFRPSTTKVFLLANNDGFNTPYSLADENLPFPVSSFKFNLNSDGYLIINGAGTPYNSIPTGSHCSLETEFFYTVEDEDDCKFKNYLISAPCAFSNITQFTKSGAITTGYRDTATNDTFKDLSAHVWVSNADQTNKTNNVMDLLVRMADLNPHGKEILRSNIMKLTNLTAKTTVINPQVSINKSSAFPNTVLVTFSISDRTGSTFDKPYFSRSTDGGNTFSSYQLIDPAWTHRVHNQDLGCDEYGNYWFVVGHYDNTVSPFIINLNYYMSSDGGNTWNLMYQTTDSDGTGPYYFDPAITFGPDGSGQYGLWCVAAFYTPPAYDDIFSVTFIPITGLGTINNSGIVSIKLPQLMNVVQAFNDVTVKPDGTLIFTCGSDWDNQIPVTYFIRPPTGSPLNANDLFLGPFTADVISNQWLYPTASYPSTNVSYQVVNKRSLLYHAELDVVCLVISQPVNLNLTDINLSNPVPYINGADCELFLILSKDLRTWSKHIQIANTQHHDRGTISVALNAQNGALYLNWYDSRNVDPNPPTGSLPYSSTQFFGAKISKKKLLSYIKQFLC